jgi:hypothetical protein
LNLLKYLLGEWQQNVSSGAIIGRDFSILWSSEVVSASFLDLFQESQEIPKFPHRYANNYFSDPFKYFQIELWRPRVKEKLIRAQNFKSKK